MTMVTRLLEGAVHAAARDLAGADAVDEVALVAGDFEVAPLDV